MKSAALLLIILLATCSACNTSDNASPLQGSLPDTANLNMKRKQKSLAAALKKHGGNYAAALESIGLGVELDDDGNITRVTDAMLQGQLNDAEFALLANIPTLTDIWLRDLQITDDGLAVLEKMPQLEGLMFDARGITDAGLKHLRHLPLLNTLHLQNSQVTGRGLSHLPHPEKLTWLDFQGSAIDDEGLKTIARCREVKTLGLWGTAVTDAGLKHLQGCQKLKRLSLDETQITDQGVKTLTTFPALVGLELSDTDATDQCLADLLKFPALQEVAFGDEQISAATLERLQSAKIEVQHGQLLNVVRTENLLRYVGIDFEVDTAESCLVAFIAPGEKEVLWRLYIDCTDKYVPEHMSGAKLEGPPIPSRKSWRELEGETLRIKFDPDKLHPISPDNSSNIYVGWHAAPNDHRIKFLKRNGNRFLIDWHCEAGESKEEHVPIWVFAEVPFTELIVVSEKPITAAEATRRAAVHFDLSDFGEPKVGDNKDFPEVRFRLIAGK